MLRPPIVQARLARRPDGLVRITLKRPYADGTVAVDMAPLSLLCRLATSVPPPRHHTVKYAGVLASASRWRSPIAPPRRRSAATRETHAHPSIALRVVEEPPPRAAIQSGMRRFLCVAVSIAIVMAAASRVEASAASRLTYSRTPNAAALCPDERGFRAAVAERLGYDPFFPWAEQTVSVALFEEKGRLRARLELIDADGVVRGARDLDGATHDCDELLRSLALATSITLDPMNVPTKESREAADPTPSAEPVVEPRRVDRIQKSADEPPDRARPLAPSPRHVASSTTWSLRAGPLLAMGESPGASVGARFGASARRGSLALLGEVRADLPTGAVSEAGGEARVNVWAGALASCWAGGVWAACGIVYLGSMQTRGSGVERPVARPLFYAASGARIEITLPVSHSVDVILHLDGLKTLTVTRLYLHQQEAWRTPPFSAALGVAAGVHFP